MQSDLAVRLGQHLVETDLFGEPGLALLAVSGGPDSVALVDLMAIGCPPLSVTLAIGHIEHGIQPETSAVVERVRELAEKYGIPFHVQRLGLGAGTSETVARRRRYEALRTIQAQVGASYLVTAHHRDDQLETVLYRFLRGSGVAGLAGIPACAPGGLVRPLLPFSRRELTEWLDARFPDGVGIPDLFEDPANLDQKHDRVWIRQTVLPLLRQRLGHDLDSKLLDVAADALGERVAWSAALRVLTEVGFRTHASSVEVARAALERYDKALSLVLLRAAAREIGCRLSRRRAAELLTFAAQGSSGRILQLGSGWEAELVFGDLRISQVAPHGDLATGCSTLDWGAAEEGSTNWGTWEFRWCIEPAEVPERGSLTTWITLGRGEIREARSGDKLLPLGGVGRRKVRRLLMEARIPASERRRYPVVARGNDIVWIPGVCRGAMCLPRVGDRAVRIDARTTRSD